MFLRTAQLVEPSLAGLLAASLIALAVSSFIRTHVRNLCSGWQFVTQN